MKRIRLIMMTLAVVIAVGGAFVTNANSTKVFAAPYGLVPDSNPSMEGNQPACLEGTLVGTCNDMGSTACKVTINGRAYGTTQFNAYNTQASQTSCTSQKFRNN